MKTASWIITEKATGRAVLETWQASVAAKVNRDLYDVTPALEYLQRLNARIKAGAA